MKHLTNIQDKEITLALEEELLSDEGVLAHLIEIQTKNGIVALSGLVDNVFASDHLQVKYGLLDFERGALSK